MKLSRRAFLGGAAAATVVVPFVPGIVKAARPGEPLYRTLPSVPKYEWVKLSGCFKTEGGPFEEMVADTMRRSTHEIADNVTQNSALYRHLQKPGTRRT